MINCSISTLRPTAQGFYLYPRHQILKPPFHFRFDQYLRHRRQSYYQLLLVPFDPFWDRESAEDPGWAYRGRHFVATFGPNRAQNELSE